MAVRQDILRWTNETRNILILPLVSGKLLIIIEHPLLLLLALHFIPFGKIVLLPQLRQDRFRWHDFY